MIFLEGEPPNEPQIVMTLLGPDGTKRHVSLRMPPNPANKTETLEAYLWPAFFVLTHDQQPKEPIPSHILKMFSDAIAFGDDGKAPS